MDVIGYEKARNLMRQLDWKMLVTMIGDSVEDIKLYHPKQPNRYKVRIDSGRKLMAECRVIGSQDYRTAILGYDWDGTDDNLI